MLNSSKFYIYWKSINVQQNEKKTNFCRFQKRCYAFGIGFFDPVFTNACLGYLDKTED